MRRAVVIAVVLVALGAGRNATTTAALFTDGADASANTIATVTMTPPAGVSATTCSNGDPRAVLVSWSPTVASAYEVVRQGLTGAPALIATVTTTSFRDTGLVRSRTYTYWVRATKGGWVSADSTGVSVTTPTRC